MFKKLLLVACVSAVAACSSDPKVSNESFPGEYADADYVLSDADAQKWVVASRQAEQCIYPDLTRIQQEHFSKEDSYIYSQYVFFYPLEKIIGEQYVKILQADEKSMGYATYQYKRFKTDKFEPLPDEECKKLQTNARDDLAVVKGQYKSGMVETKTSADGKTTNTDGVATNENKFFFDIIKWGSTLLL